ncbi:MAG: acyl--CoA ligase [Chitinophagaceae bacterium]|nr:acyl--CoA ligase [Chitinophagaceae bacterium]
MQSFLEAAWRLDLAQALPVDHTGFRLQTLLGRQQYLPEKQEQALNSFWKQAVKWHSGETWVQTARESLSFQQGDELIELTKKALICEGLMKGDKLLLCTDIHYETLIIFWAAVSLGMIVVPISPKASIGNSLKTISPSMAIADPEFYQTVAAYAKCRTIMTDITDDPLYESAKSFETFLSTFLEAEVPAYDYGSGEDIAVILSTTGSTGNPKLIPLTHAQLIRSGRLMTETYHWKKKDRYYGLGGLETMSGLRNATVCVAEAGATCILPEPGNNIHQHFEMIRQERITIITANPLFFRQLLFAAHTAGGTNSLAEIRLALCTGNVLPARIREEWKTKTGSGLLNYYGLTETSGICIAEPPGFQYLDERSIGLPAGCLVRITDEKGNQLPPGEVGQLTIYGAGIFEGYYQNEQATEKVLKQGWFSSGDLAAFQEDGSIFLHGRMSDLVKLPSGERIELSAIEELMSDIDLITDWAVCPVMEYEKEFIAVFFVPKEKARAEEIQEVIKERIMTRIGMFAVPKLVAAVDYIPRGNHNKVLRSALTNKFINA